MKRSSRALAIGIVPVIFFAAIAACSSADGPGIEDVPDTGTDGRSDAKPNTNSATDGATDDATTDQKSPDAGGKDADASDGSDDEPDADAGDEPDADAGDEPDADAGSEPDADAGNDADAAPLCTPAQQACTMNEECCAGLECGGNGIQTQCVPAAPKCVDAQGDCAGGKKCCGDLVCNASNVCEAPPVCIETGQLCQAPGSVCCPGLVCIGFFDLRCTPGIPF